MAIPPYALTHALDKSKIKTAKRGPFGLVFRRPGPTRKRGKPAPPIPVLLPPVPKPPGSPAPNAPKSKQAKKALLYRRNRDNYFYPY